MARTRKQAEQAAKPTPDADDKQAEEGKAAKPKTGRMTSFKSHGKDFLRLSIPRHLHDRLTVGAEYEVSVEDDGRIVATPVS